MPHLMASSASSSSPTWTEVIMASRDLLQQSTLDGHVPRAKCTQYPDAERRSPAWHTAAKRSRHFPRHIREALYIAQKMPPEGGIALAWLRAASRDQAGSITCIL